MVENQFCQGIMEKVRGTSAARFVQKLKERIETGNSLVTEDVSDNKT